MGTTLATPAAVRPSDPFLVFGRVNGDERLISAPGPADVLELMLSWLRADNDAVAVWYLREDWPEALTLVGRPARGLVGESRRCAHLFRPAPGDALHSSVTALCGAELHLHEIEWLRLGAGMPCEPCLVRAGQDLPPRRLGGERDYERENRGRDAGTTHPCA